MNHLNGQIAIGAPHSLARYREAKHICADCLEKAPSEMSFKALMIGETPAIIWGQCYVCEANKLVVLLDILQFSE